MGEESASTFEYSLIPILLSDAFFISAMVILNFILLKMTITIVIIRYKYLREKIQLENQAHARIIAEDSNKYRKKWIHLLLCRKPRSIHTSQSNEDEEENTNQIPFWTKFRLNFEEIKNHSKLKTKEQREKELSEAKRKILKEKFKRYQELKNRFMPENIGQHKRKFLLMLLYIVYLVLFIVIVLMQMGIEKSYELQSVSELIKQDIAKTYTLTERIYKTTGTYVQPSEFVFDDIISTPEVIDWMGMVMNNYLFTPTGIIANQNYVFGDPVVRFSARLLSKHENVNSKSKRVFQYRISNKKYGFDDSLGGEEMTDPLPLSDGTILNHTKAGSRNSPLEMGGYIVDVSLDNLDITSILSELYTQDTITTSWSILVMEFLYFSRNHEAIIENDVVFTRSAAGTINKQYTTYVIWRYYTNSLDYFRGFLEIVFVLIY